MGCFNSNITPVQLNKRDFNLNKSLFNLYISDFNSNISLIQPNKRDPN
ncbi:hypothetical protein GGR22_001740 [Flavobacterium gossypii]|uniref:Uncharacterized protein n=1 Tax=Flavobacterium gossypii TaxID=1646119 RepID=A0ABR6DPK8_9FLAO|nr:hypothetical protein [Flavobacterium gossypii]